MNTPGERRWRYPFTTVLTVVRVSPLFARCLTTAVYRDGGVSAVSGL